MWVHYCHREGGTASRRRQSFSRHRLPTRPPSRSDRWLADANGLVAALVDATDLGRPVLEIRPFPPTLYQQWGGLRRRRQLSRRCERTIGLLVRTSCRCKSSRQQRLTSRPLPRSIGWLADTNGLIAALVIATYLGRPTRQRRPLPPTLNRQWGGLHRRLCPISRRLERTIGLLVRIYLTPSNPAPLKVPLQLTRGGDSMIPSATTASFFHRGSVHDERSVLGMFVDDMALGPPIHSLWWAPSATGLYSIYWMGLRLSVRFLSLGLLFGF